VLKFEYDNAREARKKVATDWACKLHHTNLGLLVKHMMLRHKALN
jgi:hypothetical protein